MKQISIIGAGPAGMVAALNLRHEGYEVTVWEKEKRVGGPPDWHPSVHGTPVDMENMWKYIGIDLSSCFSKFDINKRQALFGTDLVDSEEFFSSIGMGGKDFNSYVVERGDRPTSLDCVLYQKALKEGVKFVFNKSLTKENIKDVPKGSIIATGLGTEAYDILEIPYTNYSGYWAYLDITPAEETMCAYFGAIVNEYGYSSYANGIWYILLFSRKEIPQEGLAQFAETVKRIEGKDIKQWLRFHGRTPKGLRLFHKDYILTGTLAGFIEPALGYGITGALVSGKIAALAVTDRDKAEAEFNRFTSGIPDYIKWKKNPEYRPTIKMGKVWFDIKAGG